MKEINLLSLVESFYNLEADIYKTYLNVRVSRQKQCKQPTIPICYYMI